MSASPLCPVCSLPLGVPRTAGALTTCAGCTERAGAHVFRDPRVGGCASCAAGGDADDPGLHCARIASGVVPSRFPIVEPPFLEAAPAWMGEAVAVLAASDEWSGFEAGLTGLARGLCRFAPGVALHVAMFDGLDSSTNRPCQLISVFVVTAEPLPEAVMQGIDRIMAEMSLVPQGEQELAPVSPVPIVFAAHGVTWRAWVEMDGAPTALFIGRGGGGDPEWVGTRAFERARQVGGFADGDVQLVNY